MKFFNTGKEYDADEIGVLKMEMVARQELRTGDVGYIISGIKTSKEVKWEIRLLTLPVRAKKPLQVLRK